LQTARDDRRVMLPAASRPTLAKDARMGHPHFGMGKEEQSMDKGGPAPVDDFVSLG